MCLGSLKTTYNDHVMMPTPTFLHLLHLGRMESDFNLVSYFEWLLHAVNGRGTCNSEKTGTLVSGALLIDLLFDFTFSYRA